MPRPLYQRLAHRTLRLGTGNAGLWYDKLCDRWDDRWTLPGDEKLAWIETITQHRVGLASLLTESTARSLRLATTKRGVFGIFVNESRFVTGLGRSHPVENGFGWHPTLGVPYLPGSSIKGLVRAWAEHEAEPPLSRARVDELLGSSGSTGQVAFIDAVPIAPVQLEADVITPHYAGWNSDEPPGDWRGPVPIPFLVTARDTAFAFSIVPLRDTSAASTKESFDWLQAALMHGGAGAKTSVGYGRFRLDEPKTQEWMQRLDQERCAHTAAARRDEARLTPEGRWCLELEGKSEQQVLELVRIHFEKSPLEDPAERRALAQVVKSTGFVELWRKGRKNDASTQTGEAKLKQRAAMIEQALCGSKA